MISIKEISHINKPIVWTMHDMWTFCGGEHFTNNLRNQNNYSSFNRPKNESGFDTNKWNYSSRLHSKIITSNGKSVILFNATSSVNFRKGFNF